MEITLGKKIAELRRREELTQEQLAEQMNVSAQAVSKWENDIAYPDIMSLSKLAKILHTSVDDLLSKEDKPLETKVIPVEQRKNLNEMLLHIHILSKEGDKVQVNIPVSIIKIALKTGMQLPQISGNDILKSVDFEQILTMLDNGVIGKLIDIQSKDGDIVEITVE